MYKPQNSSHYFHGLQNNTTQLNIANFFLLLDWLQLFSNSYLTLVIKHFRLREADNTPFSVHNQDLEWLPLHHSNEPRRNAKDHH